jgi:hypothetical protein
MKIIIVLALIGGLAGCAIEGIGFDGRVNAYRAASQDSREYIALHAGQRDSAWYAGWCDVLRPHFQRMTDEAGRVNRYCAAMQAQPDNAPQIAHALGQELEQSANGAQANRTSALNAVAVMSQQQHEERMITQQQVPLITTPTVTPAVNCTSYAVGNQVHTNCQ